jgi:hypothetical protein
MKQLFFEDIEDLGVFRDLNYPQNYYGMTIESANIKRTIEQQSTNQIISDDKTIKVYQILYKEERDNYSQTYQTDRTRMINFPINRIEGILVEILKK